MKLKQSENKWNFERQSELLQQENEKLQILNKQTREGGENAYFVKHFKDWHSIASLDWPYYSKKKMRTVRCDFGFAGLPNDTVN